MEISKFDPSIVIFKNSLEPDFCKRLINKFNKDERKKKSSVYTDSNETVIDENVRQSQELNISFLEDWREEDSIFFNSLSKHLNDYMHYVTEKYYKAPHIESDSGYQIQKTAPGGFFTWHVDAGGSEVKRKLTYIWYLNSCKEGNTEFICGESIKPETGKLIIFPATWPYVHRGTPPKTTKYICAGWLS